MDIITYMEYPDLDHASIFDMKMPVQCWTWFLVE